ncbi:pilin [Photobacterium indicum]|uniref:Pilus assembly protein PilA n=1 Tax=Photobacterium indicum TaxID=81447 RepID=A0A2T3L3N0_9GAMM|nr:pilin [Photobacterium indicum]PSV43828.1 pilus assembly protein PilA [Photobacterium indicum]
MKKMQKGFTLIELMIVVAIIGVLSAIAIPAYQNYVSRSEAASGLATVKALITPAELFIQESGNLQTTTTLDNIGTTGVANSLGVVTISAENTLLFTFNGTSSINAETFTLARDVDTGWACAASGTMPAVDGCS